MKLLALLVILCGFGVGCVSTDGGALGVADQVITDPAQKAALVKIRDILVGKQVNQLEGFDRTITYRYRGEPIDPADLSREIVWKKREAISDSQFKASGAAAEPLTTDAALVSEIEAILKAAGVE